MKTSQLLQITYQSSSEQHRTALTRFFGIIDTTQTYGYHVNHSTKPNLLMIDPEHLYDVADALGYPIKYSPDDMIKALETCTYPKFLGKTTVKTTLWKNQQTLHCWTFDLSKAEQTLKKHNPSTTAAQAPTYVQKEQLLSLKSQLAIWLDTASAVPPSTPITYSAESLVENLAHLIAQIERIERIDRSEKT